MLSYPETRDLYMAEILGRKIQMSLCSDKLTEAGSISVRKMFKQRPEYASGREKRKSYMLILYFRTLQRLESW
jgi:hypothetical protein